MVSHSKFYFSLAVIICAKSTQKIIVYSLGLLWRWDCIEKHGSARQKVLHRTGSAANIRKKRRGRQVVYHSSLWFDTNGDVTMDVNCGYTLRIQHYYFSRMNISGSHWWREGNHLVEAVLVALCLLWIGRDETVTPSASKWYQWSVCNLKRALKSGLFVSKSFCIAWIMSSLLVSGLCKPS